MFIMQRTQYDIWFHLLSSSLVQQLNLPSVKMADLDEDKILEIHDLLQAAELAEKCGFPEEEYEDMQDTEAFRIYLMSKLPKQETDLKLVSDETILIFEYSSKAI